MRAFLLFLLAPALLSAAAPAPVAKPALWKIADADTTIYLFGTVHVLKPGVDWFHGPVATAFAASDQVVLEMVEPPPAEANAIMLAHAVDPDGPPLSAKLGAKDAARLHALLTGWGINPMSLETMEPWFVSTLVSLLPLQKLGYDPATGVDRTLAKAAQDAGKPVEGLETMAQQIGYFDALPEQDQLAMLRESLKEAPEMQEMADKMTQSWAKGQTGALAALTRKGMDETPKMTRILLTDRNRRWANWIAQRLNQPGTVFVAVGAAHLAGKDSVQQDLARLKLRVARIN
ncbi:MAG: TraB/GumN family protein [Chakrabartia sp.]